ncbi:lipid kinase [Amaricoccus sp.]|uniref:lipid kinase n=1 Tax=Amaricoccus sp. TaxID=1872485 RepID=UPI00261E0E12|nr:lipid kinase [Amaricoccus sp.]HRO12312.1 lipid kinase [Amaricoccus sp.]
MVYLPGQAPPRHAVVLVNPGARRGGDAIDGLLAKFRAAGIAVRESELGSPEEIERHIREGGGETDCAPDGAPDGAPDCAIVCGGDGSLCLAAPGLLATGVTLGILPMGTANDLARTLGIPDDLEAAADIIIAGRQRRIDLGTVNGTPFFNVASIGLSVELARELSGELKRRWGRVGYALAALRALLRAERFSALVTEGEETLRTRTMQVAVGNGRFYGGGTVVAEDATIDDGHLDLYSLEIRNVLQLALMLRSFRSGAHGAWSEVKTLRGTEFEIRTRHPRPVNADGELIAETPAVFKVHPGAVTVYAPPPAEAPSIRP